MFFKSKEGSEPILEFYNQKLPNLCVEYSEKLVATQFRYTNFKEKKRK